MNVRRVLVILSLLLCLAHSSFPSENTALASFPVGENLTYRIHWGMIPVGETMITSEWVKEDERDLIRIRLRTRTNKWMDKIHKIDDDVYATVEPGTLLPVRSVEMVHDKDKQAEETTTFDHAGRIAHWQSALDGRTSNYVIEADTRDVVSFLYFMRSRTMKPGEEALVTVAAFQTLHQMRLRAERIEKVDLANYSDIPCLVVRPEAVNASLFARKAPQRAWVSTDARHLIAKMDAKVVVGTVHLTLYEVGGPGDDFWVKKKQDD
jgi:hypothetical protein